MKFVKFSLFFVVGLLFSSFSSVAQEQMTLADYEQANAYTYANLWNKKVFNLSTSVTEFEDHSGIWFVNYTEAGKEYKTLSFKNLEVQPPFDQSKLAEALSEILNKKQDADQL
ncbi:MAG: hypothetical protein VYD98_08810 [Bacteroidota bacterium]|nr:hypothetical protein [Bacteroidota bacterium]